MRKQISMGATYKRLRNVVFPMALSVFLASSFSPVLAATTTIDINATILPALTVSELSPLDFSSIIPGAGSGSVSISHQGQTSKSGSSAFFGSPTPAMVQIEGQPDMEVQLSVSSNNVTLVSASGAEMEVTDFDVNGTGSDVADIQIGPSGSMHIGIGATLLVASGQESGDYSGSFTVIVDHQ